MTFKLENRYILAVGEMLAVVPMKAGRSRHRTRMIKLFNEHLKDYTSEKEAMLSEFAILDEEGNLVADDMGQAIFNSDEAKQNFIDSIEELNREFMYIEGEKNKESLKKVYHGLNETDREFAGAEAVAYDVLMEALEDYLEL